MRVAWRLYGCKFLLVVAGLFVWLAKTYPGLMPFALAAACPLVRIAHRFYHKALAALPADAAGMARDLGARVLPPT